MDDGIGMERAFLESSIRALAVMIYNSDDCGQYGGESTIHPGFYDIVTSPSKPGRTWIRHYDACLYEVDSDDLKSNTQWKEVTEGP